MLTTVVSFLVLLLVLIFIHELGHFLAAKFLGVRVERFSLGFPPKLFSKKVGETEYQLALLPLGGYVKLFGEEPGQEIAPEEVQFSFSHKPAWVKSIVVAAGPLFNVFLAIFLLWGLSWAVGIEHLGATLGPLDPASPAARAGLKMDDVVTAIDGRPIKYFDELWDSEKDGGGLAVKLSVLRDGLSQDFEVKPDRVEGRTLFNDVTQNYSYGLSPRTRSVVGQVIDGKPAQKAGLLPGDEIVSVNGEPTTDWSDVVRAIQGPPGSRARENPESPEPLTLFVLRNGNPQTLAITPVMEPSQNLDGKTLYTPIIGMTPKLELLAEEVGIYKALKMGLTDTWQAVELTFLTVVKLFQRKISAKIMGGPLMIAEIAGQKAKSGLADFITLMAFISVNLAILNILPLPVLDGGQLFFFIIEGIRRKPLPLRFREISQWVGVTALAALMILVFYNDISRIVTRFTGPPVAVEEKVQ